MGGGGKPEDALGRQLASVNAESTEHWRRLAEQAKEYRELRNQLVKRVKTTYFDLFFVDKSIETVQPHAC